MKIDPTINVPSMLAAVGLAFTMGTAWSINGERHAKNETFLKAQELRINSIQERSNADRKEFKEDVLRALEEIKRDVRDIKSQGHRK